jgi:glycolate oxidase iron-sulfur subunit
VTTAALRDTPLARSAAGLDACVHCGFCLTSCPTYLALENENDSPRGRLVIMRGLLEGDVSPMDRDTTAHLDRCLGCRGCETACPSGVPYGELLEATRATVSRARPLPWRARFVLTLFSHDLLLRFALACARAVRWTRIPDGLARRLGVRAFPFAMLAVTARRRRQRHRYAVEMPLIGSDPDTSNAMESRKRVALLTGCVMEGLLAPVNRDTEFVLRAHGYEVLSERGQRCCGALHAHAGDDAAARRLARINIAAFEHSGADHIVTNAAGCGAMLRQYHHLFADEPGWRERASAVAARTRDISELLAAELRRPESAEAVVPSDVADKAAARTGVPSTRVAYDAPCHLQHAQRVVLPPLAMLGAVENITLVPLTGSDQCCGSAGIFNLVEPTVAQLVLRPKLEAIAVSGADVIATGNPGCMMQIGAGLLCSGSRVETRHPVELLAESYAARVRR